jgi:hypothetical protein
MYAHRTNANVDPFLPSLLFLTRILPPCASIMFLEMNNPNPVPVSDFAANFENNRGYISGSIP